jgi:hypothetical protein
MKALPVAAALPAWLGAMQREMRTEMARIRSWS